MYYEIANFENDLKVFYLKIGKNVKKARMSKNLTQEELAQMLNFSSTSTISNREICYNNSHFSLSQLYKISLVLNIDIETLVK